MSPQVDADDMASRLGKRQGGSVPGFAGLAAAVGEDYGWVARITVSVGPDGYAIITQKLDIALFRHERKFQYFHTLLQSIVPRRA